MLDCWSGVVLLHIMLYVGAKIAAEQRGRHFGATAAERCQQASLRIQGFKGGCDSDVWNASMGSCSVLQSRCTLVTLVPHLCSGVFRSTIR